MSDEVKLEIEEGQVEEEIIETHEDCKSKIVFDADTESIGLYCLEHEVLFDNYKSGYKILPLFEKLSEATKLAIYYDLQKTADLK